MQENRRKMIGAAAAAATAGAWPWRAFAQDKYPVKAVRIVNPNSPGGAADVIARQVAQRLGEMWGNPVVVENRAGAGGSIGSDYVARQPADGYTLVLGGIGSHAINPSLYKNIGYDPVRDFTPISLVATLSNVLLATPTFPASTLEEFIAEAKANPGKYAYGSPGNGTSPHLTGEYFCEMTGIKLIHVPYAGSAEALKDLLGGQIPLMFDTLAGASLPALRTGKVKAFGISTKARSPIMPELRTFDEAGVKGFDVMAWAALFAPKNLSPAVASRINTDLKTILAEPVTIEKLAGLGTIARWSEPADLAQFVATEVAKYKVLVRKANVKAD